jgi:hypothetical protein
MDPRTPLARRVLGPGGATAPERTFEAIVVEHLRDVVVPGLLGRAFPVRLEPERA